MFGRSYVIDTFIAEYNKSQREQIYRIYVTDALKVMAENTAHFAGGGMLNVRYADIIHPPKEETRTSDEIISGIRDKLRNIGGE